MASKPNILIGTPSDIPTPSSGQVQYFVNTSDENKPYYKDDAGASFPVAGFDTDAEGCGCEITKKVWGSVACALEKGLMTPTEFNAFVAQGFAMAEVPTTHGGKVVYTGTPAVVQSFITTNSIVF